jgi:hypothetical protein
MEENEKIDIPGENFHIEIYHEAENKILFQFVCNNPYTKLTEEDKKKIEEDIKDLGKWRIYKKLKKELE